MPDEVVNTDSHTVCSIAGVLMYLTVSVIATLKQSVGIHSTRMLVITMYSFTLCLLVFE